MIRSVHILSIVLLLASASVIKAQTPLTCGTVTIDGPSEVEQGAPVVFKAKITGMIHPTKPELKWKLSAGTITSGQGTEEIVVDSTGLGGQVVTVTVELAGVPQGCKAASRAMEVKGSPIVCFLPFDEYGDLRFEDEKARLDNFAIQISNEPLSIGQILMAAGQETFENETRDRLARAKSYLVNVRGIDPNRILTLDCGFTRELSIRLVIFPATVAPLSCDDSIEIPFSEVKFTKPRPKSSKTRR